MGLFKKSDDGDDSNRRALFGRKNKSPAPPANPYAKPIPTNPYTKAKIEAGVAPLRHLSNQLQETNPPPRPQPHPSQPPPVLLQDTHRINMATRADMERIDLAVAVVVPLHVLGATEV